MPALIGTMPRGTGRRVSSCLIKKVCFSPGCTNAPRSSSIPALGQTIVSAPSRFVKSLLKLPAMPKPRRFLHKFPRPIRRHTSLLL